MDRSQARSELERLGIDYTDVKKFLDSARSGNLEDVKLFVAAGMPVDAVGGEYGGTALHEAAYGGSLAVVQYLVEREADVNTRDDYGYTPRGRAHKGGRRDVMKYLEVVLGRSAGGAELSTGGGGV